MRRLDGWKNNKLSSVDRAERAGAVIVLGKCAEAFEGVEVEVVVDQPQLVSALGF
jgi:hypothetical protein